MRQFKALLGGKSGKGKVHVFNELVPGMEIECVAETRKNNDFIIKVFTVESIDEDTIKGKPYTIFKLKSAEHGHTEFLLPSEYGNDDEYISYQDDDMTVSFRCT